MLDAVVRIGLMYAILAGTVAAVMYTMKWASRPNKPPPGVGS